MCETATQKSVSAKAIRMLSIGLYNNLKKTWFFQPHLQSYRLRWCIFNLNMRCSIFKFRIRIKGQTDYTHDSMTIWPTFQSTLVDKRHTDLVGPHSFPPITSTLSGDSMCFTLYANQIEVQLQIYQFYQCDLIDLAFQIAYISLLFRNNRVEWKLIDDVFT